MDKKRRIFAFFLTAVILPAILVVSFHHHTPLQESVCLDCAHHIPHGHLRNNANTDDCLICQFLTVSWLGSLAGSSFIPDVQVCFIRRIAVFSPTAASPIELCPRAPPVLCS